MIKNNLKLTATRSLLFLIILIFTACGHTQDRPERSSKIQEDLTQILKDLKEKYAYQADKLVDWDCLEDHYRRQADTVNSSIATTLLFEYLLDEFYDSHLILNTNTNASYRLFAPIYTSTDQHKTIITNVWQTQITNLRSEIIGAEITHFNGVDFQKKIDDFPTHCHDKKQKEIRNWIANKILGGRYDQARVLTLKLKDGTIKEEFDLDLLSIKKEETLLSVKKIDNIGYIRIHNSLGNNDLVAEFDRALDGLMDTKGLILDLRNTVDGGNTTVARPIMGRFIDKKLPYQKHSKKDKTWLEYTEPKGPQYLQPVVVLVDRWTGSMGEGLTIGLEGMGRGEIVGTEMERLAGAMNGFPFKHRNFSYRLSTEQLFHINGIPREQYVPRHYVLPTSVRKDEILEKGISNIHAKAN